MLTCKAGTSLGRPFKSVEALRAPPLWSLFPAQVLSAKMEGVSYPKLLFLVAIVPGIVTGLELSINANTADYELVTEVGLSQSLWCTVKHPSQAEELLWMRGDREVSLQEGNRVNASNVCISPVTDEDNGVSFTCQLARDKSVQISVLLNVAYAPVLTGEDPPSIPAQWDATLDCHVKANPPAQLTWLKDNETLRLEDSRYWVFQTSELFQLTINQLQASDGGIYTCLAHSPRGMSQEKMPFPTEAVIAAGVVLSLIALFALAVRWQKFIQCFKKADASSHTAL
ncbi:hypothetical protein E2320_018065 [Naja naja]|nr:hypothetical protein E2320_018065 [Naja naja]